MNDPILPLPGLSPAGGKPVVVKFDGGLLSSDGGVLAVREVERRLRVADELAACMVDPRAPDQITHSLADIDISRSQGAPAPLKGGGNGERRNEKVVAKAPAFPARPEVFDRVGLQPAVLSVPSRD